MKNRIPAYPLITIDPFCSIWADGDTLNKSHTMLWNGIPKSILGKIKVDGRSKRFLGYEDYDVEKYMWQSDRDVRPIISSYTLECGEVKIIVKFWSPQILGDIYLLSLPIGFIDYEVFSNDGKNHEVEIEFMLHENICSNKPDDRFYKSYGRYAVMYNKDKAPLAYSGDGVEADWGKYYLYGESVCVKDDSFYRLCSSHKGNITPKKSYKAFDIVAFDDIYSIEYMGSKLKCIWTEKYRNIVKVCEYCEKNHNALLKKAENFEQSLINDAEPFGENYITVISTAYRHVLAGHKLVRDGKGNLLYMSKECYSNGCINTVDVSFPAIPLFYLYNPELIPAMMNGIFDFASKPIWKYDFSPHDIGIYPLADGQIYGSYRIPENEHRGIYKRKTDIVSYLDDEQMPIENSGNMIIMVYAYYLLTGDKKYLKKHFDMLKKWADYLVKYGDSKELQLCTDDFAGKFKGNINLTIKASVALYAFSKIAELFGADYYEYKKEAKSKVNLVMKEGKENGHLMLAFDNKGTWSLKYNMIWDKIFGFGLFPLSLYEKEAALYLLKSNTYGVPLNSLRTFTKSDWEMWVSAFPKGVSLTRIISKKLVDFLEHTSDRVPFTDFYDTHTGEWTQQMCHRTVQGGLWMPVLVKKFSSLRKV